MRLTSGRAALQRLELDFDRSQVAWMRSGSGPELEHVEFEQSVDGTNYTALGTAHRTNGVWQQNISAPPRGQSFYLRARGRAGDGQSSGIIESDAQFYRNTAPRFGAITVESNGAPRLRFTGQPGIYYDILASAGLHTNWALVGTATNSSSSEFNYLDSPATNAPLQFYRLRAVRNRLARRARGW